MVSRYCPIVYNFDVDQATDSNILNDYRIIVHMLPMSNHKNLAKKKKRWWYMVYIRSKRL